MQRLPQALSMKLPDTNVFLYAVSPLISHHKHAALWLRDTFSTGIKLDFLD